MSLCLYFRICLDHSMFLLIQTTRKWWCRALNCCVIYDITKWISSRLKWLRMHTKFHLHLVNQNWNGLQTPIIMISKAPCNAHLFWSFSARDSFSIKLCRRLERVVRLDTGDRKWEKFGISFVLYVTWDGGKWRNRRSWHLSDNCKKLSLEPIRFSPHMHDSRNQTWMKMW